MQGNGPVIDGLREPINGEGVSAVPLPQTEPLNAGNADAAGQRPPDPQSADSNSSEQQHDAEMFSADAQVIPSTANAKDRTIDVVWYSGASVPRIDRTTGEPYMLQLDMQGCRFDRLNNGFHERGGRAEVDRDAGLSGAERRAL